MPCLAGEHLGGGGLCGFGGFGAELQGRVLGFRVLSEAPDPKNPRARNPKP